MAGLAGIVAMGSSVALDRFTERFLPTAAGSTGLCNRFSISLIAVVVLVGTHPRQAIERRLIHGLFSWLGTIHREPAAGSSQQQSGRVVDFRMKSDSGLEADRQR
jgi:hypothetical protein